MSFWLQLDPTTDLEPGFCDPIQITDSAYNDAAIWVDFTKDNPRDFRLGIIGDLKSWNPDNTPPDMNPEFERRLIKVTQPPFARGKWTHVLINSFGLSSATSIMRTRIYRLSFLTRRASLYLMFVEAAATLVVKFKREPSVLIALCRIARDL